MSKSNIDLKRLRHLIDLAQTQSDRRYRLGEACRHRREDRKHAELALENYRRARHGIVPRIHGKSASPRPDHESVLEQQIDDALRAERLAILAQEAAGREAAPAMRLARDVAEYARSVLGNNCPPDVVEYLDH